MARIAVIDDIEYIRTFVEDVFVARGHEVEGFVRAEDIPHLRWKDFDVFYVDLQLTGMHGISFIRDIYTKTHQHCVAISGSDSSLLGQAISAGAKLAIQKPISIDTLEFSLNYVLSLPRY